MRNLYNKRTYVPKTGTILATSTATNPDLHFRIDGCGAPTQFGFAFCRTAGCHRCRRHRVNEWISEAIGHLEGADQTNILWLTVMLKPCLTLDQVAKEIKSGKVAWRNLVYRIRQADPRADSLRIIGVSETDWYYPEHIDRVYPGKRDQLIHAGGRGDGVWLPHFHLIVDLRSLPREVLMRAVRKQWPGKSAVLDKLLNSNQALELNVAECLRYATKSKHQYRLGSGKDDTIRWPSYKVVEYYNMLHSQGGFSLLRFHLKPRIEPTVDDRAYFSYIEPMPIVFS